MQQISAYFLFDSIETCTLHCKGDPSDLGTKILQKL